MSPSAFSRALQTLGEIHYSKKKDGLRLIEVERKPENKRELYASLSSKGREVLETLEALLE